MKLHIPFKIVGILEGLSLLALLFIAMPMKYMMGDPSWVRVVGAAHGFLFMFYIALVVVLASEESWAKKKMILAFILSSVPFGTFYFDRKYMIAE